MWEQDVITSVFLVFKKNTTLRRRGGGGGSKGIGRHTINTDTTWRYVVNLMHRQYYVRHKQPEWTHRRKRQCIMLNIYWSVCAKFQIRSMGIESVAVQRLLQFPEMATKLVLGTAWSMDWLNCNATDTEQEDKKQYTTITLPKIRQ